MEATIKKVVLCRTTIICLIMTDSVIYLNKSLDPMMMSKLVVFALSKQDIATMEEELKIKTELIKRQENLIQEWRKELKDQLDKHKTELDRV